MRVPTAQGLLANARGATLSKLLCALLLGVGLAWAPASAQAGLFDDDEARKAILDLRQRVDAVRQSSDETGKRSSEALGRLSDDTTQMRGGLLDLQSQIEALKQDQARLRGQNEQMMRDLADVQQRQKDLSGGLDERLRKFEPVKVTVDGRDFTAEPAEKRDYDNALAVFRKGDFSAAQLAFLDILKRYPSTGYAPSSLFWLANAQYATKDYKESLSNFKALVAQFPAHVRAPEALLSAANCQTELKDNRSVRKTLEDLVKDYPQSEAAVAGRERLTRLR